jgi:predicted flap endonuclease-1-like 5' DNA nuclease
LRAIGGIGPALERKLKDYGVSSYRQIAGWTSKEIEDIESKIIRISGRVTRDRWVAQAKAAHQKKYGK